MSRYHPYARAGALLVALLRGTVGCSTYSQTWEFQPTHSEPYRGAVEVLGAAPPRPFVPVAFVAVTRSTKNVDDLLPELRARAAALGANAISDVRVRYTFANWSHVELEATGLAIRYR